MVQMPNVSMVGVSVFLATREIQNWSAESEVILQYIAIFL